MRIAIVTYYRILNYGAMLQAYALKSYLESLGHEVVFVNQARFNLARPPLLDCFVSRSVKSMVVKLSMYVRHWITDFAAEYPQTVPCRTLDDVQLATADCDAFIVGSDQIWNAKWWGQESDDDLRIAMLDFAAEDKPRLSYAVSFGNREWPTPENAKRTGECLKKFTKISVREQSGIELVRVLSGRTDAVCLLDPTLLHTADFWRAVIAKSAIIRRETESASTSPFIFKYVLGWDDEEAVLERALGAVKGKLGISRVKDVYLPVRGFFAPLCKLLGVTTKITIPKWLANVANSSFVFTDSFHGTVFSILFHRPFVSLLLRGEMKGMNERTRSLLDILGLSDRAVYADEVESWLPNIVKPIDWKDVEKRLAAWREKTADFFKLSGMMALERNVSEKEGA